MKKNYTTYIYDWDGCLARTLEVWLKVYQELFAKYQLHPTDSEITNFVFPDKDGPLKVGLAEKDLEKFSEEKFVLAHEKLNSVELYPEALESLNKWKNEGKKLAILTSSRRDSIEVSIEKYQLLDIVDMIVTEEDVTNIKPHPEGILKIMDHLGSNLGDTVIIGDSKSDLAAGQRAEIDSVLFFPEEHTAFYSIDILKHYQPTHIIKKHTEIFELSD